LPPIRQTFEGILQHGIDLVQRNGNGGLKAFLGRLDAWIAKLCKKGDRGWRRSLLDLLFYQCKVSFYRGYANAWISLIPWLRENRGLDLASEFVQTGPRPGAPALSQPSPRGVIAYSMNRSSFTSGRDCLLDESLVAVWK
jgi:hypothetical protein